LASAGLLIFLRRRALKAAIEPDIPDDLIEVEPA